MSSLGQLRQRGPVGEQHVHVAVVVVVEEGDAVAGGLDDVVLGGSAGDVPEREPRGGRHLGEPDGHFRRPQQGTAERRHDRDGHGPG